MFGRRKREAAAAEEAAREADRRALFAELAERPEHICPFLGLAGDRTGHVDGISQEHRCFAFGDPAPISAEQQTRVCQERGYGNCPRYLRGVLVIPTEELEALRRPRQTDGAAAQAPPAPARSRRRALLPVLLGLVLLVAVGGGAAYLYLSGALETGGIVPSPSATAEPTAEPSAPPSADPTESAPASAEPSASEPGASPTPEPTPVPGDEFAFYEVSVGPGSYTLLLVDANGTTQSTRTVAFDGFSFARARPIASDQGQALWIIEEGDLAGYAYDFPDSGEFGVRAVFLSASGERRSFYLDESELNQVPEATPAPIP